MLEAYKVTGEDPLRFGKHRGHKADVDMSKHEGADAEPADLSGSGHPADHVAAYTAAWRRGDAAAAATAERRGMKPAAGFHISPEAEAHIDLTDPADPEGGVAGGLAGRRARLKFARDSSFWANFFSACGALKGHALRAGGGADPPTRHHHACMVLSGRRRPGYSRIFWWDYTGSPLP